MRWCSVAARTYLRHLTIHTPVCCVSACAVAGQLYEARSGRTYLLRPAVRLLWANRRTTRSLGAKEHQTSGEQESLVAQERRAGGGLKFARGRKRGARARLQRGHLCESEAKSKGACSARGGEPRCEVPCGAAHSTVMLRERAPAPIAGEATAAMAAWRRWRRGRRSQSRRMRVGQMRQEDAMRGRRRDE